MGCHSLSKKLAERLTFSHKCGIMKGVKKDDKKGKMRKILVRDNLHGWISASDHLLRKIDKAIDYSQIYEFVEELYCQNNGRPSVDPVVLFKMVLIHHLYGSYICEKCPSWSQCTKNSKCEKTEIKHLWSEYLENVEDVRHTPKYKVLYEKGKETIESICGHQRKIRNALYILQRLTPRLTLPIGLA